jgi:hypothetical protein
LNDLRDVPDVIFDDDSVVVFVSGKVVDDVEKKIENAVSRNVLEIIDENVRGYLDRDVEDCVLKTPGTAAESWVAVHILKPVVRLVIDAMGD